MAQGRATYEIKVDARGAQQTLDGVVKGQAEKFGKLSGAINAATGQLGGMGGVAGKTLGTLKSMGEAFLVGGPIGIGLAIGAVAIGKIAEKWKESEEAAQSALTRTRETVEAVAGDIQKLVDGLDRQLVGILGKAGIEEPTIMLEKQRQKVQELKEELSDLESTTAVQWAKALRGPMMTAHEDFARQLDYTRGRIEEEEMAFLAAADAAEEYAAKLGVVKRAAAATTTKGGTTRTPRGAGAEITTRESLTADGLTFAERDARDTQEAAIRAEKHSRMLATIAKNEEAWASDMRATDTEIFNEREKEKTAIAEREAEERRKIEEEAEKQRIDNYERSAEIVMGHAMSMMNDYSALVHSAITSGFDQYLDVVEAFAAGQKVQFDVIAAGFIRHIGTQVAGLGIKQLFEGGGAMAAALLPGGQANIPGALALLASGSAALAAGTAMATTGAVWQGTIARNAGGGGGGSSTATAGRTPTRERERGMPDDSKNVGITIIGGTFLGDPSDSARRFEQSRRRSLRNVHVTGMA